MPMSIYDMGGNINQWCDTVFHKEMNPEEVRLKDPRLDDEGGAEGKLVLRGSSFSESSPDALSTGLPPGAEALHARGKCGLPLRPRSGRANARGRSTASRSGCGQARGRPGRCSGRTSRS